MGRVLESFLDDLRQISDNAADFVGNVETFSATHPLLEAILIQYIGNDF